MNIQIPYRTASLALFVAAGFMLTSCDSSSSSSYEEPATVSVVAVEDATPAAEESAAPVIAEAPEAPVDTVPTEALPPSVESSEESVQPDSETLFY